MPLNNNATPNTHVCLISEQPIPNLVPLLLEKPAKTVFLVSPQMEPQADRSQKILQPHGITVQRQGIVSAYDFREVQQVDTLSDRAGGLFGRPLLVSARRLRDSDRERAKKMEIGLIDGSDVLALKENIRRWLGLSAIPAK